MAYRKASGDKSDKPVVPAGNDFKQMQVVVEDELCTGLETKLEVLHSECVAAKNIVESFDKEIESNAMNVQVSEWVLSCHHT